ncbi:hypothetical protein BGLA2_1390049 [Burkholderia gladioli]|nr:hypothetical protein BGLA2_1390049 [Burkholderia gladioli]
MNDDTRSIERHHIAWCDDYTGLLRTTDTLGKAVTPAPPRSRIRAFLPAARRTTQPLNVTEQSWKT